MSVSALRLRTISECAICGKKLLMRDLVKDGEFLMWVCRDDYQNLHPSEHDIDVSETYPINPAPEVSIPDNNGMPAPLIGFGPNGELVFT